MACAKYMEFYFEIKVLDEAHHLWLLRIVVGSCL
jgi:hypothetical protein